MDVCESDHSPECLKDLRREEEVRKLWSSFARPNDHFQDIDGLWLGKGDFPDTRYQLCKKAPEALGPMMSFILRGCANDRGVTQLEFDPNDGSVEFSDFYEALAGRWNGLTVWKLIDVTNRNSRGRYEIFRDGSLCHDAEVGLPRFVLAQL